jgi:hypothetical protein
MLAAALAGCGATNNADVPTPPRPSPTIAAVIPNPAPAPQPAQASPTAASAPTATPGAIAAVTVAPGAFPYLWPAYLPQGMQVSPSESRVMGENEIGRDNLGFYLLTFTGDDDKRKIVVGGGSVEPLSLSGDKKSVTVADRKGTLITSGEQRLILLDSDKGTLFVFGGGVSEQDLLLVADSLLPVDVRDMRARVGAG